MALTIKKSTTLNGESRIEGNVVMTMSAEIADETAGNSFVRQVIIDQGLYSKNKKECRQDVSDFQDKVYEIEDEFIGENTKPAE
ncbi:hypothetical protein [Vagococcus carniphilus]|uniref:hypothetical protein n=1 Tax=Vagococcus carniphilus TaxID=218144 RepID=UPI003BAAC598